MIIDANTTESNYVALSGTSWTHNLFTLRFKNSASSSTPINVNLTNSLNVYSGSSVQKQYIYFDDTTYNLSAPNINIGNEVATATSTFTVSKGATVDWKSGATMTIGASGIVNIDGSLKASGTINFSLAGATMNIADGASLLYTAAKSFTMAAGTTLNIGKNSNITFVAGNQITLNGTVNSASALSFMLINASTGTLNQTAGGVTFQRGATFNSGADINIYEKITLRGGDATEARMAKLTVNDGAAITISHANNYRIIFQSNNDLVLNTVNAIKNQNDGGVILVTYSGSVNNRIHINADQIFERVYVNNSDLSLYLNNGAVAVFNPTDSNSSFGTSGTAFLKVFNFEEDSLYFAYSESVAAAVGEHVKLYSGDTEESFIGMGILGTDGWLTASIPEPSTYAAIFGAIALGLAAYRRRK